MGILDSPLVKGIVLWATASIRRGFLMAGVARGVFPCSGRYTDLRPLVRALKASCARSAEREGKYGCRHAVARFTLGGEHTTLRAPTLCHWEISRGTGGRRDSTERILVRVAEKQFVVHLCTLCQKVFRRAMAPALGVNRSAP